MRQNKGYTLVELVVAVTILLIVMAEVGALMINSQHIYRNGFYEVSIQEEAQQVIQQIEDLMINSTGGVGFDRKTHNGIESDVITITSELAQLNSSGIPTGTYDTVVYTIGLAFDVHGSGGGAAAIMPNGDPVRSDADYGTDTHPYESLILARSINGGDPTYSTLAEGVRALHVDVTKQDGAPTDAVGDMTNYQADYVTISVDMQNAQYSYTSTSSAASVYLRNRPNTKPTQPTTTMDSGAVSNDVEIDVLRYHDYDLKKYVDPSYNYFKFENSTTFYGFKADGHTLICKMNDFSNWDKSISASSPVTVICSKSSDYSDPVKIRLHTDPVSGGSYPLYAYDTWTATCTSVLPVKGICVHCASSHAMEPQLYLRKYPGPNTEVVKFGSWDLKGDDGKSYEYIDMSTVEGTADKPFINNYFMSNGSLPSGVNRGDTAGSVTIPLGVGGNFVYKTYDYKGTGDKKDSDGNIVIDNYNESGSYDWKYSGEESTFKDSVVYTWDTVPASIIGTDSNAVLLKTTSDLSAGDKYWNCIVKQCEGYIRVKVTLTWAAEPDAHVIVYGYYYPQQNGDKSAHNILLDYISAGTGDGTVGDEYTVVITTPTTTPKPTASATVDDAPDTPNGLGSYGIISYSGPFNTPGTGVGMVRITKVNDATVNIKAFSGSQTGTLTIIKNADDTYTLTAPSHEERMFVKDQIIAGEWGGADQNMLVNTGSMIMNETMKNRLVNALGITFN